MSQFDISKVDVKLLSIFCAVSEEGSISRAATRLGLSQPLISHALDRLRLAFHDPLFVRAGRSIAPTERARFLAPEISELVEKLINLSEPGQLVLSEIDTRFCLSANDFERQLIAPNVLTGLLRHASNASLRLMDTAENYVEKLRAREYDVVITPIAPPDILDIHTAPIFEDRSMCFFDSTMITAKEVAASYKDLDHAIVRFNTEKTKSVDLVLKDYGIERRVRLATPSFEALPALMRGTRLVATLPSRLRPIMFQDFGCTTPPYDFLTLNFNMIWHKTTHQSPSHKWFRSLVRDALAP